ncbi:MAG: hypothetical protein JWP91_2482 [Fibrobacteres bacterium]|nr:hypothetical protein [Fibrobacterota bacterium]
MAEKLITLICLFTGFFWLRKRARSADLEHQMGRSLIGVFVVLPGILIGEKYLFEHFHFGAYTDILFRALIVSATFPAIGFGFIKPGVLEEDGGPAGPPSAEPEPGETPSRPPPRT